MKMEAVQQIKHWVAGADMDSDTHPTLLCVNSIVYSNRIIQLCKQILGCDRLLLVRKPTSGSWLAHLLVPAMGAI